MKVLYYCPEFWSRHGGRTHARGFFAALNRLPTVAETFLYPEADAADDDPASSERDRRGKLGFLPTTVRKLVQFFKPRPDLTRALIERIQRHECDVLVIRTGTQYPSLRGIRRACPDVVVCLEINSAYLDESFPGLCFRRFFQQLEVNRWADADAIFVVSSYLRDYLEARGIPGEKVIVNQNGVTAEVTDLAGVPDMRDQLGIPQDAFVIGYIGGMETFRRLPEVVTHISEMRQAGHDDIYLLMVGDGSDMPAVRAALETHAAVLNGAVILTGWVEHADVPRYLASFDLAIFPFTNAYCSPLKLFEYLGAGIATVGPDTPAVREVFEDGVHLALVKQDGSDFVDRVLEMKRSPELRTRMGRSGQRLVLQEYTWEKNAQRVVAHARELVNGE